MSLGSLLSPDVDAGLIEFDVFALAVKLLLRTPLQLVGVKGPLRVVRGDDHDLTIIGPGSGGRKPRVCQEVDEGGQGEIDIRDVGKITRDAALRSVHVDHESISLDRVPVGQFA